MTNGSGDLTESARASFSPISPLAAACHRPRRRHQPHDPFDPARAPLTPVPHDDEDVPIRRVLPVSTSRVVLVLLTTGRALPSDGPETSVDLMSGEDLRRYTATRLFAPVHHTEIALPCGRMLRDHDALSDYVEAAGTPDEVLGCRVFFQTFPMNPNPENPFVPRGLDVSGSATRAATPSPTCSSSLKHCGCWTTRPSRGGARPSSATSTPRSPPRASANGLWAKRSARWKRRPPAKAAEAARAAEAAKSTETENATFDAELTLAEPVTASAKEAPKAVAVRVADPDEEGISSDARPPRQRATHRPNPRQRWEAKNPRPALDCCSEFALDHGTPAARAAAEPATTCEGQTAAVPTVAVSCTTVEPPTAQTSNRNGAGRRGHQGKKGKRRGMVDDVKPLPDAEDAAEDSARDTPTGQGDAVPPTSCDVPAYPILPLRDDDGSGVSSQPEMPNDPGVIDCTSNQPTATTNSVGETLGSLNAPNSGGIKTTSLPVSRAPVESCRQAAGRWRQSKRGRGACPRHGVVATQLLLVDDATETSTPTNSSRPTSRVAEDPPHDIGDLGLADNPEPPQPKRSSVSDGTACNAEPATDVLVSPCAPGDAECPHASSVPPGPVGSTRGDDNKKKSKATNRSAAAAGPPASSKHAKKPLPGIGKKTTAPRVGPVKSAKEREEEELLRQVEAGEVVIPREHSARVQRAVARIAGSVLLKDFNLELQGYVLAESMDAGGPSTDATANATDRPRVLPGPLLELAPADHDAFIQCVKLIALLESSDLSYGDFHAATNTAMRCLFECVPDALEYRPVRMLYVSVHLGLARRKMLLTTQADGVPTNPLFTLREALSHIRKAVQGVVNVNDMQTDVGLVIETARLEACTRAALLDAPADDGLRCLYGLVCQVRSEMTSQLFGTFRRYTEESATNAVAFFVSTQPVPADFYEQIEGRIFVVAEVLEAVITASVSSDVIARDWVPTAAATLDMWGIDLRSCGALRAVLPPTAAATFATRGQKAVASQIAAERRFRSTHDLTNSRVYTAKIRALQTGAEMLITAAVRRAVAARKQNHRVPESTRVAFLGGASSAG
jgi:hypothetical protein